MNWIFRSQRIGKDGRIFEMLKFRTLKENKGITTFAQQEEYTWCGRFLRKTKIDELPQLLNWLKRDINIVGPRAEEVKTVRIIPLGIRAKLFSVRPGLTSLASIHYFDEGQILGKSDDPHKIYWKQIKPVKIMLDCFYVDNHDIFLDAWIIFKTAWIIIKSFFRK